MLVNSLQLVTIIWDLSQMISLLRKKSLLVTDNRSEMKKMSTISVFTAATGQYFCFGQKRTVITAE